jgi:hypothetical protein
VSKFAVGVVDTCGNLPPASLSPKANLPPESTTHAELVAKFAAGVVDTGGKFAAGVVDTNGNLLPASLSQTANLPPESITQAELVAKFAAGVVDTGGNLTPVSLTPVVHLDLRISPRIFEAKHLVTLSL